MNDKLLLENVAETAHWLWAHWMKYQISRGKRTHKIRAHKHWDEMSDGRTIHDGTTYSCANGCDVDSFGRDNIECPKSELTIDEKDITQWERQMLLSYSDLSEKEKESDRELAKQIIGNWTYNPFTGEKL